MRHHPTDPTGPAAGGQPPVTRARRSVSRRGFLGGAALTGVAAAAATAVAGCTDADTGSDGAGAGSGSADKSESFRGEHQSGILAGPAAYAVVAAFDSLAPDRAALAAGMRQLSEQLEAAFAVASNGDPAEPTDPSAAPDQPPADPGLLVGLGPDEGTALTHATVSVGASLFDQRYGLADRRPLGLTPMPDGLSGTDVLDPVRTHGDLLLVLGGAHPDVALQHLRAVLRSTSSWLRLRWSQETFLRPDAEPRPDGVSTRNLLGFKDGTANPDVGLPDLMNDVVWVGADSGEPAWATGGSYQAVRLIRLMVESWDATALDQQQRVFGRQKASGAPLGGEKESDVPVYPADPDGKVVPLTAHIRLANPRDGKARLMLRRSMSYSRGTDPAGQLDQGLVFVSYQSTLDAFLQAQGRLSGEPLEAFTRTEGGGFFFALPGAGTDGWVGQTLLES